MTDHLDITIHGFARDHVSGDRLYGDETITIERGTTRRTIVDPLGLVDAIHHHTTSRRIAAWELQGLLDRQALRHRLEAIPEARRRSEYRRIARQQRGSDATPCASCGGSGWIEDATRGRGYECPACRGS